MPETTALQETTRIVQADGVQTVRIPDNLRFTGDQVYIRRDPSRGIVELSEKPFRPSLQEVFAAFDALDLSDFEIERDHSLPRDINL
jgi:virulence-associated protein VagC